MIARRSGSEANPNGFSKTRTVATERPAGTVNCRTGSVTARFRTFLQNTAGRAVSRRSKVGLSAFGLCPRKRDIPSG